MGPIPADCDADRDQGRGSGLRLIHGRADVDLPADERAVADLLAALGQDPADAHLRDTPRRVVASFVELTSPRPFGVTTFPNEGYDEPVVARAVPWAGFLALAGARS